MAELRFRGKDIIAAIKGSGGIKKIIASRLGCYRGTVDNYLRRYPTVKQAFEDEVQSIGDLCESKMIEKIKAGESDMIRFCLRTRYKDRGYGERGNVGSDQLPSSPQRDSLAYYNSLPPERALEELKEIIASLQMEAARKEVEIAEIAEVGDSEEAEE